MILTFVLIRHTALEEMYNMEIKYINLKTPYFMPMESESCRAYYLKTVEELHRTLYNICCNYRMRIGNWDSYYESDRKNYEKFIKELQWNLDFIVGLNRKDLFTEEINLPEGPDWYIIQKYSETKSYWSDNREQYEDSSEDYIAITKLSDIRHRVDDFFKNFEQDTSS